MISPDSLALNAASYQDMTSTPPEVVKDILSATDYAYSAYLDCPGGRASKLRYPEVKQSPNCIFVADNTSEYLAGLGYQSDTLNVYFPRTQNGKVGEMFHLVSAIYLPGDDEGPIIADATWQQFLPYRNNRPKVSKLRGLLKKEVYPDVLIGTSAEIAKVALHAGFDDTQSQIWRPE